MTLFVVISLLLAAITGAVLAWPLRRTRAVFIAFIVAVPVLALGLYSLIGVPAALDPGQRRAPGTLDEAIAQLQADLQRDPRQIEGWRLLGRALQEQGRLDASRDAFEQAARLDPENLGVQVEYAESRSRAHPERRFDDEAISVLEQVLAYDPGQERARLFLGIAYRQAGRDADAASTWESLLPDLGPQAAAGLRAQIDDARLAAGLDPLPAVADAPEQDAADAGHTVRVRVTVDPDYAARIHLDPESVLFVLARVPGGPPMPVAVQRRRVADLPFELTLSDQDSPMPTQTLSALEDVEIVARVSASGTATPSDGDLSSRPVRVRLPADGVVDLVIGAAP